MLDEKLLRELRRYVEFYNDDVFVVLESPVPMKAQSIELTDYINQKKKPTLSEVLFARIDERGLKDAAVYKKAGIDRRHFSKIRSNPDYQVRKQTAIALALALELDREETDQLLNAAGYSLSESDTNDLVIQFCLEKKIYNLHDVNEALGHFGLKPLTGLH